MHSQWEHGRYYWTITPDPLNQAIMSLDAALQSAQHTNTWYNLMALLRNGNKSQWDAR